MCGASVRPQSCPSPRPVQSSPSLPPVQSVQSHSTPGLVLSSFSPLPVRAQSSPVQSQFTSSPLPVHSQFSSSPSPPPVYSIPPPFQFQSAPSLGAGRSSRERPAPRAKASVCPTYPRNWVWRRPGRVSFGNGRGINCPRTWPRVPGESSFFSL